MIPILKNAEIAPNIFEMVVEHPRLAQKAQPGNFIIVMAEETGERIPLTIADFDRVKGTITMVIMAVGTTTRKIVKLQAGDNLHAMIGPLGHASDLSSIGTAGDVVMVAGGVGVAPVYPIARALHGILHERGDRVISIQGARSKEMLFWQEKLAAVSDEHILVTDDGSAGRKALVTEPLREILQRSASGSNSGVGCVFMIGPAVMMKFCAETVKPFGVRGVASLNSVMIDGTGMCGGCRVKVGDETKFTCVDGPEFDAAAVDWALLLSRQKMYHAEEKCSLNRYVENAT